MLEILDLVKVSAMDPVWVDIVRGRDPYLFITSWGLTHNLFFVLAGVQMLVLWREAAHLWNGRKRREIVLMLLIPTLLFFISFVTVDIFKWNSFVQIQLSRSLVLVKIVLAILFAAYAWKEAEKHPDDYLFNFFLIGIVAATVVRELIVLIFLPFFTLLYLQRWWGSKQTEVWDIPKWLHAAVLMGAFLLSVILSTNTRDFLVPLLITTIIITVAGVLWIAWKRWAGFRVALLAIMAIAYVSNPWVETFSLKPSLASETAFVEACDWIKEHTVVADVFVGEPFTGAGEEVKFLCERNLFYSGKDGAQVLFNEAYAYEWDRKNKILKGRSDEEVVESLKTEQVDYVFSEKKIDILRASLQFSNDSYFIYKI